MNESSDSRTALALMRMALALLDRGGEHLAAARLAAAVDTLTERSSLAAKCAQGRTPAGRGE